MPVSALYADPPVQKDRSFELTALGPDVLRWLDWLELAGRSDRTLDQYSRDLSRGCLMFPTLPLERWSHKECQDVVKSFPKDSRRVRASAWDSFFTWAVRQDRIDRNPMDKLPQIKRAPQKFIDVFSDAEVDDLLSLPLADAALMGILFDCGLRKAEARMLQVRRITLAPRRGWCGQMTHCVPHGSHTQAAKVPVTEDVHKDWGVGASTVGGGLAGAVPGYQDSGELVLSEGVCGNPSSTGPDSNPGTTQTEPDAKEPNLAPSESTGELVVIAGKGGKDRTIQFGSRLHGLLQDLLYLEPMNPQDYLWYSRPGGGPVNRTRPIGDGSFDRWWRRCLKSAGVRYRNPHVTRHSFAVRWLRRGGRLETLSKVMGHSSIATTADCYGGIGAEDVLRDLALMEAR